MPFSSAKPITAEALLSKRTGCSFNGAALYLQGLSPGVGEIGPCRLAHEQCLGDRYELPEITPTELPAVLAIFKAKFVNKHGGYVGPDPERLEHAVARKNLALCTIAEQQTAFFGRLIDAAVEELRASRLQMAAE